VSAGSDELSPLARSRAEFVGRSWATRLRAAIVLEQRRPCGGWPGTLSEARAHVASSLLPWLDNQGLPPASSRQCEGAARVVYASARTAWMETRESEEDA
jgi:hypothetical protein